MGGFSNVLGHVAGGFEEARQQDLTRQFTDEQNRRAQIGGLLQKIAMDENAHPYSRNAATQEYLNLAQTPYGKKYKFDPDKLVAPASTQQQASFTPPPAPPLQLGNISLPPAPPQTATLAQDVPAGIYKTHPQLEEEAVSGMGRGAAATAGGTLSAQIAARQHALAGINPPLPPEENAAFALGLPPTMIGAYGQASTITAKQAAASGMTLPPGVDPETGWVRIEYNRMGHPMAINPSVAPSAYAPTTSEGFTYQTDAQGNTIAVPVTTTRTKTTPGISAPPAPPSASVSPEKGKKVGVMKPPQALMINPPATPGAPATAQAIRPGSQVNPQAVTAAGLSSANVPTSTIRTMAQRSQGQLQGIQQLDAEVDRMEKAGKIGPLAGRINDFMQGHVGEGDPEYAYLNNKVSLLQTSMMLIHIGARSSPPILKKFEAMMDAGKMDGPTLKAGIRAVREQMEIYAKEGKIAGFGGPEAPKPPEEKKGFNWNDHPVIK